jgi:hypothetical protein
MTENENLVLYFVRRNNKKMLFHYCEPLRRRGNPDPTIIKKALSNTDEIIFIY